MNKLGFGLMRLPQTDDDYRSVDLKKFQEMADEFIAAGGTYFDTAYSYHGGESERAFREAVVKRYPRDAYTITDKLPMFMITTAEQMYSIFPEQFERCGVEYFDYYWLHALGSRSYEIAQRIKAFEFIAQKKKEGRLRHIGFSFHDSPQLLERILTEHPEMEYVQLQLNYLDWEDITVRARECCEVAARFGKPVIVMEPLKGGALAEVPEEAEKLFKELRPDMSVASWALRFAGTPDNVITVLSGMSNMEQLRDNISSMVDFKPLTDSEMQTVAKVADIIRSSIAIPCTACRYCIDGCPKHIAIPDCFSIYNNFKRFEAAQRVVAGTYYKNLVKDHGKASECIGCGKCEGHCPQHLPIRNHLKQVASVFES